MNAFVAAGAGFLLAVLWFDLMFDVQAAGHAEVPEPALASIAAYYARVTTAARPMNRLIAAVMAATLAAIVVEIAGSTEPAWLGWVSLGLALAAIGLAGLRTVPAAVRLGNAPRPAAGAEPARSRGARPARVLLRGDRVRDRPAAGLRLRGCRPGERLRSESVPMMRRLLTTLLLAGAGACALAAPALAADEAFVRVDQLGYGALAPKRAYLMANFDAAGTPFTVSGEGGTVFSGTVGQSTGSWSKSYPFVYALDFDALHAPGRYTITAGGAGSPPFAVAAAGGLYAPALANALSFYENERDGPQYVPSALRTAPAHLNDEHASAYSTPKVNGQGAFKGDLHSVGTTLDASGGWWDAGDYLKFVETTSYTVDEMLAGVRDFPALMGTAAPASQDFAGEARFGLEWLLRMFDAETGTLYYQVGIGEGNRQTAGDHDIWRLPQADDAFGGENPLYRYIRNRPVFRAGAPGAPVSPNLAGRDAAAFGLCFQVFHASDPAFADRCLRAGERIFALADTKHKGHLLTAIPFGFYPEREWRDDLELGATELSLALSSGGALPPGPGAHRTGLLPRRSGELGQGIRQALQAQLGHAQPLRRQRSGAFRAGSRAARRRQPVRSRDRRSRPAREPAGRAAVGPEPGGQGPLRLRLPLGGSRHGLPRRRPRGDGLGVRLSDGRNDLRRRRRALARQRARRQRVGRLDGDRRRHRVPALPLPPGREPGRLARRLAARARRRRGGGPEQRIELGRSRRDAGVPARAAATRTHASTAAAPCSPTTPNRSRRPSPRSISRPARCWRSRGRPRRPLRFRRRRDRAPNRIGRSGRVAQWESARFTRERSQVRNPPRP